MIALGAGTALAMGGLVWWGMQERGDYAAAKDGYDDAANEIRRLTRTEPYPSADNRLAKQTAVEEYASSVGDLQQAFDPYRAPNLEAIDVDAFTDALLASRKQVLESFDSVGAEVPEDFFQGLERYTEEPVKRGDAPLINFQLEAFTELFTKLAEARPAELLNVHRPLLPEEEGRTLELEGRTYRAHPIEVSFRGRESTFYDFLSSLDDSERFYYLIRTMRIKNQRDTAPNARDARFERAVVAPETDDFGFPDDGDFSGGAGDFDAGGDFEGGAAEDGAAGDEAEEAPAEAPAAAPGDSGEILKQVLGDEMVDVFLRIEVLQFLEAQPISKG